MEAAEQAEYLSRRWRCWEGCQTLHTQLFLDVWTKTDEQRHCSETIFSVPHSTPQRDQGETTEKGEREKEKEGGEREREERECTPHCRDKNPGRKLGTAEARAGRCCQTRRPLR